MPNLNKALFMISDLHLSEKTPEITRDFLSFLTRYQDEMASLYLLGDFFDAWIGDDDPSPFFKEIQNRLFLLTQKGVTVFFMPGNRDFLLGNAWCEKSGVTRLPDPTTIEHHGVRYILTHGDLLCENDTSYRRYRKIVQSPWIKKIFLSLPLFIRQHIARTLRKKSQMKARNPSVAHPISTQDVLSMLNDAQCNCMIHGHIHQLGYHNDSIETERYVLSDWQPGKGSFIQITSRPTLHWFPDQEE